MRKLLPFVLIATCFGQITPPRAAIMISANGLPPFAPLTSASGLGAINTTPTYQFVPMCSATGLPPYSQCTFGSGTTTAALTGAASGGAPPGATFNGSAPVTFDYHTVGAAQNVFPNNIRLTVDGASNTIGNNTQQEVYLSSQSTGTGYSGTCTTSISGLSSTTPPTVGAFPIAGTTGVAFAITYFGRGVTGTGTVTVSSCTGTTGTGATATLMPYANPYANPWPNQLQNLSALSGKVASFTNYAVSGTTIADANTRFTSNGYAAICANNSYNEYFLIGGDLVQNSVYNPGPPTYGVTPQVANSQLVSLSRALIANGCHVIWATPILRNFPVATTISKSINQAAGLMRNDIQCTAANRPNCDYDYIIDFGSQVQNTSDEQAFSWDDIHFTGSGHGNIAGMANSALLAGGVVNSIVAPSNLPPDHWQLLNRAFTTGSFTGGGTGTTAASVQLLPTTIPNPAGPTVSLSPAGYYRACGQLIITATTQTTGPTLSLNYNTTIGLNSAVAHNLFTGVATGTTSEGGGVCSTFYSGSGAVITGNIVQSVILTGTVTYALFYTLEYAGSNP